MVNCRRPQSNDRTVPASPPVCLQLRRPMACKRNARRASPTGGRREPAHVTACDHPAALRKAVCLRACGFVGGGDAARRETVRADRFRSHRGSGGFSKMRAGSFPKNSTNYTSNVALPSMTATRFRRDVMTGWNQSQTRVRDTFFFYNHSADHERCITGKPVKAAFARWVGVSKGLQKNSVGIAGVEGPEK
jgi:hypothetical protein